MLAGLLMEGRLAQPSEGDVDIKLHVLCGSAFPSLVICSKELIREILKNMKFYALWLILTMTYYRILKNDKYTSIKNLKNFYVTTLYRSCEMIII